MGVASSDMGSILKKKAANLFIFLFAFWVFGAGIRAANAPFQPANSAKTFGVVVFYILPLLGLALSIRCRMKLR